MLRPLATARHRGYTHVCTITSHKARCLVPLCHKRHQQTLLASSHPRFQATCRYQQALDACQLRADLALLHHGDLTEVGERGITLSGGQKQRVALARAVYASPDVCLLDDPLAAVDAHVGAALLRDCICGALRGATVLLVTHSLHVLPRADWIVWLDGGSIAAQGTYEALCTDDAFVHMTSAHAAHDGGSQAEAIGSEKKASGSAAAGAGEDPGGTEKNLTGVHPLVTTRLRQRRAVRGTCCCTQCRSFGY